MGVALVLDQLKLLLRRVSRRHVGPDCIVLQIALDPIWLAIVTINVLLLDGADLHQSVLQEVFLVHRCLVCCVDGFSFILLGLGGLCGRRQHRDLVLLHFDLISVAILHRVVQVGRRIEVLSMRFVLGLILQKSALAHLVADGVVSACDRVQGLVSLGEVKSLSKSVLDTLRVSLPAGWDESLHPAATWHGDQPAQPLLLGPF